MDSTVVHLFPRALSSKRRGVEVLEDPRELIAYRERRDAIFDIASQIERDPGILADWFTGTGIARFGYLTAEEMLDLRMDGILIAFLFDIIRADRLVTRPPGPAITPAY
jgi:hypothetical protein